MPQFEAFMEEWVRDHGIVLSPEEKRADEENVRVALERETTSPWIITNCGDPYNGFI